MKRTSGTPAVASRRPAHRLSWMLLGCALWLSLPTPAAHARTHWRFPCTTGYAVGSAIALGGAAATSSSSHGVAALDSIGGGVLGGLVFGGLAGWAIGGSADDHLAAGETLSRTHRNAVRAGTVLFGGSLGTIMGAMAIASPGDNGRDGEIVAGSIAGGLVAGALLQWALDSRLDAAPTVSRTGAGEGPVALGLAFTW